MADFLYNLTLQLLSEEAVNEVKRQAMLELQKTIKAAEMKANELVTTERIKMERAISDARKQAHDEVLCKVNHQEESSEVNVRIVCEL